MNIVQLPIDLIDQTGALRELDADYVELIAASMADRDQDAPIHVMALDGRGLYRLIAGRHRVAAKRRLGCPTITAIVFDGTEIDARLLRVDENLMRRELSPLDRAKFLRERRELFLQKRQQSNTSQPIDEADCAILALGADFVREAGKKLRISRRDVFRGLARAELPEDVCKRIALTDLALKGAALDALVALGDPDKQRRAVELALDHGRKLADAVREVRGLPPVSDTAATDRFNTFLRLWKRMGDAERERVREHVNPKPSRARKGRG